MTSYANRRIPVTGVRVVDVKETIGEETFSVARLCASERVNMWSRYKPMALPADFYTLEEYRAAAALNGYGITYRGTVCYGSPTQLISDRTKSVFYERAAAAKPYRLGDFRHYLHGAVSITDQPGALVGQEVFLNDVTYFQKLVQTTDAEYTIHPAEVMNNAFDPQTTETFLGLMLYNPSTGALLNQYGAWLAGVDRLTAADWAFLGVSSLAAATQIGVMEFYATRKRLRTDSGYQQNANDIFFSFLPGYTFTLKSGANPASDPATYIQVNAVIETLTTSGSITLKEGLAGVITVNTCVFRLLSVSGSVVYTLDIGAVTASQLPKTASFRYWNTNGVKWEVLINGQIKMTGMCMMESFNGGQ